MAHRLQGGDGKDISACPKAWAKYKEWEGEGKAGGWLAAGGGARGPAAASAAGCMDRPAQSKKQQAAPAGVGVNHVNHVNHQRKLKGREGANVVLY